MRIFRLFIAATCLTTVCFLMPHLAGAADINLLGYTAGNRLPPAAPSSPAKPLDVRAQLQAAIDEVAASGGGTVFIPGDTDNWFVGKPVFLDKPNVTLRGEVGTTIAPIERGNGDWACVPPLLVGIPRQVAGKEITPGHRENLTYDAARVSQTLDAGAGTRYGLRTKGRNAAGSADVYAHGYIANSLLAAGPLEPRYLGRYTAWRCPHDADGKPRPDWYKLTFDLAIKQNVAGAMRGTICGVGTANDINNRFTCWMLGTFPHDSNPDVIKFKFKTGPPNAGPGTVHELALGSITDTMLHRLTIQLDMGSGQCAAWLDGKQSGTLALGSVMNAEGTSNPQRELWRYEQGAFQLGALHNGSLGDVTTQGLLPTQQHVDWTYGGFQLAVGLRYAWDRNQRRSDNQPINDAWRFFAPLDGQVVSANLPLTDNPSGAAGQTDAILVPIAEGQDRGGAYGYWLPERPPVKDADGLLGLRKIRLEKLALGGPLEVGEVRELSLYQVNPRGQNIFTYDDLNSGVLNGNALPVIKDTDCGRFVYSPSLCVLLWQNKEVISTDFSCIPTPYTTVRLVGCHGEFRDFFLNANQGEYYLQSLAGARGGTLAIVNPCLDNEGYPAPTQAAFRVEFSPLGHGVTRATNHFDFRNNFIGTAPATTPILELPNVGEGSVSCENVSAVPIGAPFMKRLILDKNPNAYGTVHWFLPYGRVWENTTYYGPSANIGDIYFNKADGYYYRCTSPHHPGESYEKNPNNGQQLSEDNRPHRDEAWKTFWSKAANNPPVWKSGATYAVGDVVMSDVPVVIYINLPRAFRCLAGNTAGDANKPGSGSDWQKSWVPLEWGEGTSYNAGSDYVSADGAYYHCLKANAASAANRPRPWEKLPVNAATWPFQIVEYAGPAGTTCKLMTEHYEFTPQVPPPSGVGKTNADIAYASSPQPGQPTDYRVVQGGAPGVWRGENPLAPAPQK